MHSLIVCRAIVLDAATVVVVMVGTGKSDSRSHTGEMGESERVLEMEGAGLSDSHLPSGCFSRMPGKSVLKISLYSPTAIDTSLYLEHSEGVCSPLKLLCRDAHTEVTGGLQR